MELKLNCLERIRLFELLLEYKESDFATFKTLRSLKSKLGINEDETKEYEFKIEDKKYLWNEKGWEEKGFDITDGELSLVEERLKKLDEEKKLTEVFCLLYEKIIESKEPKEITN